MRALSRTAAATSLALAASLLLVCGTAIAASGAAKRAYERADYAEAIEKLTPEAEKGDPEAQYLLSRSLRATLRKSPTGGAPQGSETDPLQSTVHAWMLKAANGGFPAAMTGLAEQFDEGFGTPVDYDAALGWMQKGLEAGDDRARTLLVRWYTTGHIVAPDPAKAADMNKFAALAKNDTQERVEAMQQFFSAARDYVDARHVLRSRYTDEQLAEAGDPRAARRLARKASRDDPEEGRSKDCAAAARWYERATELGDAVSFVDLGKMFYRGECAAPDLAKARAAFERGAAIGHAAALEQLAQMAMFGHGQPVDYARAYELLQLERALGSSRSWTGPGPLSFVSRKLPSDTIARADATVASRAAELRPAVERRRSRETVRPVKSAGTSSAPYAYTLKRVDPTGACADNYLDKCAYVPFDTLLEIENRRATTLDCRMKLVASFFPATEQQTIERRYIVFPQATKRPGIGTIAGDVDAAASSVVCEEVSAPTVASGTCVLETPPGADPSKFYSKEAIKKKQQGAVVLDVLVEKSGTPPADVQVATSSGFPLVDDAGVQFARTTAFATNCPGERIPLPLRFKVED